MMNSVDLSSRTPVTLVTGFLGAGKSTLLNRLIRVFSGTRFGIVVNEFGEIPLENEIIQAQQGDVLEFSNGCLCCVARNDLLRSVRALRRNRHKLDHILVEASGLSDPVPVARTFLEGPGRRKFEFGAMVCVVDAPQIEYSAAVYDIVFTQLQYCDFVYVTRSSEVSVADRRRLEGFLAANAPNAKILSDESSRELEVLLAVGGIDAAARGDGLEGTLADAPHASADSSMDHEHASHSVDTLLFESDRPFDQEAFRDLLAALPPEILRAKGVVHFSGTKRGKFEYLLQVAGSRRALDARRRKRGETAYTRLLFLGRGLDKDELHSRLESCIDERS